MTTNDPESTQRARILLTVKASPEIGRTHGETVCVAGLRLDTERPTWIRLFPVQWPFFFGNAHPKYQVIDVDITKHHKDQRPESYRPALDTVTLFRSKSTRQQRFETLNSLPQPTMCDLLAQKGWSRTSLALVVPQDITGLDYKVANPSAIRRKASLAAQGSLLDQHGRPLEFPSQVFQFAYRCRSSACSGHNQTIVDWEITEACRTWKTRYPSDSLERVKAKWKGLVAPSKNPAFFVGNQQQSPQGFLILGVTSNIIHRLPQDSDSQPSVPRSRSTGGKNKNQPQNTEPRLFDL
jgi:hypothetical protein